MGDFKDSNGKTRVGMFLQSMGSVGDDILRLAGDLTGIEALNAIGDAIGKNEQIKAEDKQLCYDLIVKDIDDRKNARDSNVQIQQSQHSSWLAKNTIYIVAICLMVLLVGIIIALFKMNIPENNENTLHMVLGMTIGYVGAVITFFFGSSEGSKSKTEGLIQKLKNI